MYRQHRLRRLVQEKSGILSALDGTFVKAARIGLLKTLPVQSPCIDIDSIVRSLAKERSEFIPERANAYVASEFNPDTKFIRDGKEYSVYAFQFYLI